MKNLGLIVIFLLVVVSCQKTDEPASSADSQSVDQRSQSPRIFKATLESSLNTDPAFPLTLCSGDLPEFAVPDHLLAGQATHLGNLITNLSRLHHDACNLSFATLTLSTNVSGQLAAANGDLVYYTGEDVIDVSGLLTGTSTTGSIEGTWTITGGTGRFEGASGSLTISGIVDFITGTFTAEANGAIAY